MCGRFTLSSSAEVVAEMFQLSEVLQLVPRYNIAPTQPAPVVRLDREAQQRRFDPLHWGLIPHWAKDPGIGSRLINARCETAADKPSFRAAFRQRRCLIVADGFYEWKKIEGGKQPYCIRMKEGGPFAMAGLWEHWEGGDGSIIDSCTILTTDANEILQPVHPRMPVILSRDDYDQWLDVKIEKPDQLTPLLRPCASELITIYPVSTHVNRPANDDPTCAEPLPS